MQKLRWALWALIGIGSLAGLYGAALRFPVEQSNRRVELALDLAEVQKLATLEGLPTAGVLKHFSERGITSLAITEDTLGSLEESRRIEVVPSAKLGVSYIMTHQGTFPRILAALQNRTHFTLDPANEYAQIRIPPDALRLTTERKVEDMGLELFQQFSQLKSIGVGLDPNLIILANKSNMEVIGRVENSGNIPTEGIGWLLGQLKDQGVKTVIFAGDDVLGYSDQLKTTADALENRQLKVGIVEFSKMKGDAALHSLATKNVIRVHNILPAEMATASPEENIQRFSLAARERNIRLLYIRLFLEKSNPLQMNLEYVEKLKLALERANLVIGPAHTYPEFSLPLWARALIGVGIGAAFLLLADTFGGVLQAPRHPLSILAFLGALLLVALAVVSAKLGALSAAIVFAALAVTVPDLLAPFRPADGPLRATLLRLGSVLFITTLGILALVGLLAAQPFLTKAQAFVGIKAALYLPLLLASLYWGLGLRAESPAALVSLLRQRVRSGLSLLNDPVRYWQVGAGVLALIVLALLWLRSGNDGAAVVSGFELRFRDLLDAALPVRPRFKATLFAALMLGMYLAGRGERRGSIPIFLLGVIAVTDYLNTFCHLHIPLLVSVMRDSLGVALGGGLGLLVLAVLERHRRKTGRPE